jgi:hypothetical protein
MDTAYVATSFGLGLFAFLLGFVIGTKIKLVRKIEETF